MQADALQVIRRWINYTLGNKHPEVKDLKKDMADGVALIKLAHILTGKVSIMSWLRSVHVQLMPH